MKRNIKMILEYDGTRYYGWQRLGNDTNTNTIQGKLEEVLSKMTGEEISVIGSGRTDAGVHALGQTANFHTDCRKSCQEIRTYLSSYLPKDIFVYSVEDVPERFHSRLSASSKTYLYRIAKPDFPSVFDRRYTWQFPETLDLSSMRQAASVLIGVHDFKGFSSLKKTKKSTVREIYSLDIIELEREIQIRIRGNGFLYNMVRIICGTLVDIGRGTLPQTAAAQILSSCDRKDAGITAPPQGLFLETVEYPESTLQMNH